jgi:hypothetical protein
MAKSAFGQLTGFDSNSRGKFNHRSTKLNNAPDWKGSLNPVARFLADLPVAMADRASCFRLR